MDVAVANADIYVADDGTSYETYCDNAKALTWGMGMSLAVAASLY